MSGEISTIQSLKAVDAWIDVINANINGGVRTGFKSSRLKFSGSNVDIVRAGSSTSLPLQLPEAGLTTANTVLDFSQGAVTASTESTHLAIQGEGFFLVASPDVVASNGNLAPWSASTKLYLTRDGEFRTNQDGMLVNSAGYFLIVPEVWIATGGLVYSSAAFPATGNALRMRAVFNNIDITTPPAVGAAGSRAYKLTDFLNNAFTQPAQFTLADNVTLENGSGGAGSLKSLIKVPQGKQSLLFSQFGSTIFDPKFTIGGPNGGLPDPNIRTDVASSTDATILSKSLEASNASMTQSVPELSLAQKLFSALTKVLQTKQTNIDGVLNLVR